MEVVAWSAAALAPSLEPAHQAAPPLQEAGTDRCQPSEPGENTPSAHTAGSW